MEANTKPRTKRLTASISLEVSFSLRNRMQRLVDDDQDRYPTIAQVAREAFGLALPQMERLSRRAIAKRQPLEES